MGGSTRERGRTAGDKWEKGRTQATLLPPVRLDNSRTHARTRRNDFPAGVASSTPQPPILMVVLIDPDLGWLKYIDGGPDRSGVRSVKY